MDTSLSSVIDLYSFPTGRRIFALAQVVKRASAAKLTELAKHCNAALAHDRECLSLERQWAGVAAEARRKSAVPVAAGSPPGATKVDAQVDRTLTAIRDTAASQTAGSAPDDPIHTTVASFLKAILPTGNVQDVTTLPYVEELAVVDDILRKFKGELAPAVEELGLTRLHKKLADLAEQYRAALQASAPETLEFGKVRAARAEGQERLLEAVVLILGKHYSRSPEHVAARAQLLGPILEQNAAIGAALRGRRSVEDVDPETGEPDPNATAPIPEPSPAPAGG